MELRPYQQEALGSIYEEFFDNEKQTALVVLPTGAGKTPVLAAVAKEAACNGARCVILAHVKELLQQSVDKLKATDPDLDVGVYSAGLKSRDTDAAIIVAGIQSIYSRASELGKIRLVIIDECHRIPDDENTRYRIFISELMVENPDLKILGLTATPFRMDDGLIYGKGQLFERVCHETHIPDLIKAGYLCPLRNKAGDALAVPELSGVKSRGGDYIPAELEAKVNQEPLVDAMIRDILVKAAGRKSVLVFAVSIEHAETIWKKLGKHGEIVAMITGETPSPERALMLKQFKDGEIRFLVNVMVLTEGFDAPNIDCVVLARPTQSGGLYYQMVGRGFRLHESKSDCLILDYGSNIRTHGPINAIRPDAKGKSEKVTVKECKSCGEYVPVAAKTCHICQYIFPPAQIERSMPGSASESDRPIIASLYDCSTKIVTDVTYTVHTKRDAPNGTPRTLKVMYHHGHIQFTMEFICVEHSGYARGKAEKWWRQRCSLPCPTNADEALEICRSGALAEPESIVVVTKAGSKFPEITKYKMKPIPQEAVVDSDEYF